VDGEWTRTSYSGLTDGLHEFTARSIADESDVVGDAAAQSAADDADSPEHEHEQHVSPLSDMPAGTQFGLIVHEALEHLDTNPETLETDMALLCERFVAHTPLPGLESGPLAHGLLAVMHTPLGALTAGRSLADVPSSDRLAELSFELPLGPAVRDSGDRLGRQPAGARRKVADLAALFSDRSLVPEGDPLAAYGPALSGSEAATRTLSGWLTGSIDALLRLPDGRFVIVDYKTNRFTTPNGSPLYAEQYSPAAMASAMIEAHYPLQALLYCVATSRFLAQRIPNFALDTHLAGVGYLFVRGMIGPETPVINPSSCAQSQDPGTGHDTPGINSVPCGVFTWHPTPQLIEAASRVLSGGGEA
jgi:exodeoxyribonuclease V beta subunit